MSVYDSSGPKTNRSSAASHKSSQYEDVFLRVRVYYPGHVQGKAGPGHVQGKAGPPLPGLGHAEIVSVPEEREREMLSQAVEKLRRELEGARAARQTAEKQREEIVHKAKTLQTQTQNRRIQARDVWKKRYYEEKKKTPVLEEEVARRRHELDVQHRRLLYLLEHGKDSQQADTGRDEKKPSDKNNYRIAATRLRNELDDSKQRVENAKMKLTTEMKLRNQAETELRALRAELTQKKIGVTLSRNAHLLPAAETAALSPRDASPRAPPSVEPQLA